MGHENERQATLAAIQKEDVRTQTASNTLRDICQTIVWWSPKD